MYTPLAALPPHLVQQKRSVKFSMGWNKHKCNTQPEYIYIYFFLFFYYIYIFFFSLLFALVEEVKPPDKRDTLQNEFINREIIINVY